MSSVAIAMSAAGVAAFLIGIPNATRRIAAARGLDTMLALTSLCVAIPLAVFGALHVFGPQFVKNIVPAYMPWRMFWVYAVGAGLLAASLSIATGIAVRASGLLFGIMMFLFVALIHLPGAIASGHDRIIWTIVFRESSFGGAGWLLAGTAMSGRGQDRGGLIAVGRACVTIALIVFGFEHFLHPLGMPGVPLAKLMPAWVPGRVIVDDVTGAALLAVAGSVLIGRGTRTVGAGVGGWLLGLIVVIYVPVMLGALFNPGVGVQLEGINYFADTLLFTGAVLALASATPTGA